MSAAAAASEEVPLNVDIVVIPPDERGYQSGSSRTVTFRISNTGSKPLVGQKIRVSGSGLWYGGVQYVPEIPSGKELDVAVVQQPLAGALLRDLKDTLSVEYAGECFEFNESPFHVGRAVRNVGFPPGRSLRLGILGPMGSGKTTMVNMLATVLHGPGGFRRPAAPGSGVDSHTLDVNEYRFGDIVVCDAYGIDKDSWKPQHLRWYVDGTLPKGITLEDVQKLKTHEVELLRRTKDKRRKDVILFCVSATAVVAPVNDPKKRESVSAFANVRDFNPIVVVTQVDNVIAEVTAANFDQHVVAFAELRQKAAAMFCVEPRRVFPMMSYRHEKQRSPALDLAAYQLIEAGAEFAGTKLEQETAIAALDPRVASDWKSLISAGIPAGAKKK